MKVYNNLFGIKHDSDNPFLSSENTKNVYVWDLKKHFLKYYS